MKNEKKKIEQSEKESRPRIIDSTLIVTTLICLLPVAAGIYFYDRLPDNLARHFDMYGNPNGYSPKWVVLFLLPFGMAALNIFLNIVTRTQKIPKQMQIIKSWLVPVISVAVFIVTLVFNMKGNLPFDVITFTSLIVGIVFVLVGNYCPKVPFEYVNVPELSGLADTEEATARYKTLVIRFISRSMFVAGFILLVTCFTPIRMPVLFIATFGNILMIPVGIIIAQRKIYRNN